MTLDGADPQSVRDAIAEVVKRFGRIDILVNNAGSTGPKQPIEHVPLDRDELAALQKRGATDSETVGDALRNIFGVGFNVARSSRAAHGRGRVDHQHLDHLLPHAILCANRLCRAEGGDECLVARACRWNSGRAGFA